MKEPGPGSVINGISVSNCYGGFRDRPPLMTFKQFSGDVDFRGSKTHAFVGNWASRVSKTESPRKTVSENGLKIFWRWIFGHFRTTSEIVSMIRLNGVYDEVKLSLR